MKKVVAFAVAAPLFALAACSGSSDQDSLRSEIAGVRATAQAADQKATEALATAQRAAQDAAMANQKVDRVFNSGLRK